MHELSERNTELANQRSQLEIFQQRAYALTKQLASTRQELSSLKSDNDHLKESLKIVQ